jgi:hypothetical protein
MVMRWSQVVGMCVDGMPSFLRQHRYARNLDFWLRAHQEDEDNQTGGLFVPNTYSQTEEHAQLSQRAYTPWAGLVVDTLAQTMFVEGVRMPGTADNLASWEYWQRNGWDAYQSRIYRSALGYGLAYASVLPGEDRLTRAPMPKLQGHSALKMAAFYAEDDDEFPLFAIRCERYSNPTKGEIGWTVRFYDDEAIHYLSCIGDGYDAKDWTYISYDLHNSGVPPIVRYSNMHDLDGRTQGEIEPVIPILRRIDQDTYDRLIVQRYGAWKIRYITGLVKPKEMTDKEYREGLLKLKIGDFLTAVDKDTKFGTLDETQLAGFIQASDKDLRDLAAIKQIPPHHLLGTTPQMQPESLASVNASLMARSLERRTSFGESHERLFRLAALQVGNMTEANAWNMQVRWRDTETRSLSQTADALGKIATQLKVPVEMLWERIEGWTDSDTERAKELAQNGAIDALLAQFEANGLVGTGQPTPRAGTPVGS